MTGGYVVGQQIRLTSTFTTEAGNPVDPTGVLFKVCDGEGTKTTYDSPQKESTGVYHQDILITGSGVWSYRAEGTGAAIGANETTFLVQPTKF